MHGLGNDFVVVDAVNQRINFSGEQIRHLADRHFGIGFDQLLLVEAPVSDNADFKYRIFNADGSEVSQCGNGARCFARFVKDKGLLTADEITVDTNAGQLVLSMTRDGQVMVNMGIPRHKPEDIPMLLGSESVSYEIEVGGKKVNFGTVSMGNPHAVVLVENVMDAPVYEVGKLLESHAIFPERANIGFMQIVNRQQIKLRVYERGAGETLACGSGACAAAVVGIEQGWLDHDVSVELTGGQLLIYWKGRGQPVLMTGPATTVYEGTISL
jgi:diaminopimelate epimerase